MTENSLAVNSDIVFRAVEELRQLDRNILSGSFAYGKILHNLGIKNKLVGPLYKRYASHVTNEGEFAKELGKSLSSLHNIVGIYLEFEPFVRNGSMGITPTRLVRLLPLNLKDDEKEEWLHRAETYEARAFQDSINARQGKITSDDCEHDDCEPWSKCKACGKLSKV